MAGDHPTARRKPSKPYPEFPLHAHASGRWAKKIRGRRVYFGPWDDPDGALKKYLDQKDALHAGRLPRAEPDSLTVYNLANLFLQAKQDLVDNGELSPRTWSEYKVCGLMLTKHFGKGRLATDIRPDDFTALRSRMSKTWGPHRLAKMIQYVRSVFKFGYESELMDRPVRFGPGFARPTKKTLRLHRAAQGPKLFTAEQVLKLLEVSGPALRAMILLGVNCGFGNSDVGNLPLAALDLGRGWVDYPRPKTGVARRCPLWPETVAALREAIAHRPAPKDESDSALVFITKYGYSWSKDTSTNPVTQEMTKAIKAAGIEARKGVSFYALRHLHRTIADEAKDQPAADAIMGHEPPSMASVYREGVSNPRLKAVTDHVRKWLFGAAARTTRRPRKAPPAA